MLAKEVKEDAIEVFGYCDGPKLLRKVSNAVAWLRNESLWDASLGNMDIMDVGECGYITLPRDIEAPLAIQIDGIPAFPRNKWFQYHMNGSGGYSQIDSYDRFWDDLGDVVTIFDPTYPFRLELEFESEEDSGAEIMVQGYNSDSLEVTAYTGGLGDVVWSRILRITKEPTTSIVRLYAVSEDDATDRRLIGLYYPDEQEPRYRRIRVPKASCIRIQYRRAFNELNSWEDYIPLDSRYAFRNAMMAVKLMDNMDVAGAQAYRAIAVDMANKEQSKRNPKNVNPVQVNTFGMKRNERLWAKRGSFRSFRGSSW